MPQPPGRISTEGTCILLPPSSALIKTHHCTLKRFKCFGTSLGTAKGIQSEGKAGSLPSARWLACLSPAHVMHYKTVRSLQIQQQHYAGESKAEVRNPWSSWGSITQTGCQHLQWPFFFFFYFFLTPLLYEKLMGTATVTSTPPPWLMESPARPGN